MALRIDRSGIANWEEVCLQADKKTLSPLTQTLELLMMTVCMGWIDKENAHEFYMRVHMLEVWGGPYLYRDKHTCLVYDAKHERWCTLDELVWESDDPCARLSIDNIQVRTKREPHYITLEDVQKHIGLTANVSYVPFSTWWERQRAIQMPREERLSHDEENLQVSIRVLEFMAMNVDEAGKALYGHMDPYGLDGDTDHVWKARKAVEKLTNTAKRLLSELQSEEE